MTTTSEPTTYTIAQVAAANKLTPRALRFYESRGLVMPTRRLRGRVYSVNDTMRIGEIIRGTEMGFTIAEIGVMLEESETGPWLNIPPDKLEAQLKLMREKRSEIDAGIDVLLAIAARQKRVAFGG